MGLGCVEETMLRLGVAEKKIFQNIFRSKLQDLFVSDIIKTIILLIRENFI
jgi:hypothetical protein